jgi:hypothetical protein
MLLRAAVLLMAVASFGAPALAADAPATQWKFDNPFCDVVAAVAPLPDVVAATTPVSGPSRYAVDLHARSGATVAAHVTLISDTDAYDATVPEAKLSGPMEDRVTSPFIVTLPKADSIKFFFVDSYAADRAAGVTCPSYIFPIGEPLESQESGAPVLTAAHLQALGKLACGKVYQPIRLGADFGSLVGQYGNQAHAVTYDAYIDSNGRALREVLMQSSGIPDLDAAALGEIQQANFRPAQFLCTPVVGEIELNQEYFP